MYRIVLAFMLVSAFGTALADSAGAAAPPAQAAPADAQPDASAVCPQNTGTRLPRKPGDCLSSPGRTYGSEELRSTGTTNAADALRRMDPSVTTHH